MSALAGSASTLTALHGLPLLSEHLEMGLAAFSQLRAVTLRHTSHGIDRLHAAQLPLSLEELTLVLARPEADANNTSLPLLVDLDRLTNLRRISFGNYCRRKLGSWDPPTRQRGPLHPAPSLKVCLVVLELRSLLGATRVKMSTMQFYDGLVIFSNMPSCESCADDASRVSRTVAWIFMPLTALAVVQVLRFEQELGNIALHNVRTAEPYIQSDDEKQIHRDRQAAALARLRANGLTLEVCTSRAVLVGSSVSYTAGAASSFCVNSRIFCLHAGLCSCKPGSAGTSLRPLAAL